MEHPNPVAGLIAKREEIASRIEAAQRELRGLVIDLDHIEAAIRIFDPMPNLGLPSAVGQACCIQGRDGPLRPF